MRKLIVSEFLTLDGVMEAPEQWQFPFISDDMAEDIKVHILESDVLLLGRVTYDIFAASWPQQTNNEFGIADKLNSQPKFVVSSTLKKAEWKPSTLIKDNAMEAIVKLKQQPGGSIAVTGSATLVQSLMKADLIDEYRLFIHPIILGSGMKLFKDGMDSITLKLVESKTFASGVIVVTYQSVRKA
jgi:dihydrofolate reductase